MATRIGVRTPSRGTVPPPALSYRAVVLPSGQHMPIEVRLGRRLLRTIDPHSDEGVRLLRSGRVVLIPARGAHPVDH
ncbi:MAG: hypothetical protein KBD01_16065 [Acidobacteria bacterium]|nr:hypothetical protein [Acidobacteriota bacterium]